MKKITLRSGSELTITPGSFSESKNLYQAILNETKGLDFSRDFSDQVNLVKEIFTTFLASKRIEDCLWECFKRCTYKGHRITMDTFEDVSAREDYQEICMEVALENVAPFTNSLYAIFQKSMALIPKDLGPA